jgi:Nif-specific regulatory protein
VEQVIRAETGAPAQLPSPANGGMAGTVRPYLPAASHDRNEIEHALAQTHGNKSRAAQLLGLTLRQLNYRLKRLGMT